MIVRKVSAPSDPGQTTPCRYAHRAFKCPETAKSCTRDAFVEGQYESQGGPRRLMSRAYRCDKGHIISVRWTEPLP